MNNEDVNIMMTIFKIVARAFATALLLFSIYWMCKQSCDKPNPIQNNTNKITDAKKSEQVAGIDYKVKLKKSTEAVKLIPEYKDRWYKVYDTIYKTAPDTCHYYLAKLNAEKMASDSINDLVIKAYGSVIDAGIIYQAKKDSVILKQDVALKSKDTVIDSLANSKKKFWKGFRIGFWTGVGATQAVNSGSKFIK